MIKDYQNCGDGRNTHSRILIHRPSVHHVPTDPRPHWLCSSQTRQRCALAPLFSAANVSAVGSAAGLLLPLLPAPLLSLMALLALLCFAFSLPSPLRLACCFPYNSRSPTPPPPPPPPLPRPPPMAKHTPSSTTPRKTRAGQPDLSFRLRFR
jgi:hypothetical protein